jgi:hypothetical protein
MEGDRPKDLARGAPLDWNFDAQPQWQSAFAPRRAAGHLQVGEPGLALGIIPVRRSFRPEGLSTAVEDAPIRSRFTVHSVFSGIHRLSNGR